MRKQNPICEKCTGYMQYVKNGTWLKCPSCGNMKKVQKYLIKVLKK